MSIWIGDKVEVLSEPYKGIRGEIVYETKNMFWIRDGKGRRLKVPKRGTIFLVNGKYKVHGSTVMLRPGDRVVKDP